MNHKAFARFYAPTYTALLKLLSESGAGVKMFVEADWMPHIDYLAECTDRTEMQFEFGENRKRKSRK